MKISVIIPTYRRPKDLERCLKALKHQNLSADEILVVVRNTDTETLAFLKQKTKELPVQIHLVTVPGVVAAMNVGLAASDGDIIAFTDDDAAPHSDWLERIYFHFLSDDSIGGVGGRDWMYLNGELQDASVHPGASNIVGKLQWFGRIIGNHHVGVGAPREVDVLKGVNMSFRRSAIAGLRCDERLLGTGAQVHFEVALSLSVKKKGWKIIYDPVVAVDHFLAKRFDEDQRTEVFNYDACCNIAHNETVALIEHLSSGQKMVYLFWAVMIGTRGTPGFLQLLRLLPIEKGLILQKWIASIHGRIKGLKTCFQGKRSKHLIKKSAILLVI